MYLPTFYCKQRVTFNLVKLIYMIYFNITLSIIKFIRKLEINFTKFKIIPLIFHTDYWWGFLDWMMTIDTISENNNIVYIL